MVYEVERKVNDCWREKMKWKASQIHLWFVHAFYLALSSGYLILTWVWNDSACRLIWFFPPKKYVGKAILYNVCSSQTNITPDKCSFLQVYKIYKWWASKKKSLGIVICHIVISGCHWVVNFCAKSSIKILMRFYQASISFHNSAVVSLWNKFLRICGFVSEAWRLFMIFFAILLWRLWLGVLIG